MQKTITHTTNRDNSNLSPDIVKQIGKIWEETEFKPNESNQSTVVEETYAELPIANDADQPEKEENEAPDAQPGMQADLQDKQQNSQATQSKGWASTLVSVPAKIASALNPLNWLPSKNTATTEQPKIIIEGKDSNEGDSSANLDEAENPGDKTDLNKLVPDDSEFTDCTSTDPSLTGDDSNLQDN